MDVEEYIKDPDTRVYISYNDEAGEWLYAIVVENSRGYWLDAYETEQGALEYIQKNHLKMAE